LEEPTLPEDYAGHRRILDAGGVPIASGENLRSVPEFRQLIEAGGVSYPEPDVSNIGGITAWLQVARLAADAQLPVTSHGVHDLHVHLLAAVPNASYLEVHGFSLKPYLRHQLTMHEGRVVAPQRPGHGVEFDWELLAAHRAKV
jgi:L-alanine-DL-glutamate epimerase-like enolase superfamily enzyme